MNNNNVNKTSGSFNFNDVVKKIKTEPEGTPWFKKKVSIISMSSVLGVGALATVIAVPIALTSSSSTNDPTEAITAFNKKSKDDKLKAYNSIMANPTNNTAIKEYFIKQGGMSKFFNENVEEITSGSDKVTYDAFKAFLPTYKGATVSDGGTNYDVQYTPTNGDNFLAIKAIGKQAGSNTVNYDDSTNSTDVYCSHGLFANNIGRYTFYSPILSSVTNVTMNSDFSIAVALSTDSNIKNMAFRLIASTTDTTLRYIPYKTTIQFSDTTLFPGMSEFVKKSILNLTA
ncbi:MAG: hypothetical protein RR803_00005 [Malacoplasma sp.]